jgi:hypothetical protein
MFFTGAIPTFAFAIAGMLALRAKTRIAAFVLFALSLMFSFGYFRAFVYQQMGVVPFWLATEAGIIAGGIAGLPVCLILQKRRTRANSFRFEVRH